MATDPILEAFVPLLSVARLALDVFVRCDCELPHEGEQATDEEWNAAVDALRGAIAIAARLQVEGERQQHVVQRAMDAWDTTTLQKNGDGRLWQCMEELRGAFCECDLCPDEEEDASGRCKCCGKAIAEVE